MKVQKDLRLASTHTFKQRNRRLMGLHEDVEHVVDRVNNKH